MAPSPIATRPLPPAETAAASAAAMPAGGLTPTIAPDGVPTFTKRRGGYTKKACNFCAARKKKCDGGFPCSYCILHQEPCSYVRVRKKRRDFPLGLEAGEPLAPGQYVSPATGTAPLPLGPAAHPIMGAPTAAGAYMEGVSGHSLLLATSTATTSSSTSIYAGSPAGPSSLPPTGGWTTTIQELPLTLTSGAGMPSMPPLGVSPRPPGGEGTRRGQATASPSLGAAAVAAGQPIRDEELHELCVLSKFSGSLLEEYRRPAGANASALLPVGHMPMPQNPDLYHHPHYVQIFFEAIHPESSMLHRKSFLRNIHREPAILVNMIMVLGRFYHLRVMHPTHSVEQCAQGLEHGRGLPTLAEVRTIMTGPPDTHRFYAVMLLFVFLFRIKQTSDEIAELMFSAALRHQAYFTQHRALHLQEITDSPFFIDQEERIRLWWLFLDLDYSTANILCVPSRLCDIHVVRPPIPEELWDALDPPSTPMLPSPSSSMPRGPSDVSSTSSHAFAPDRAPAVGAQPSSNAASASPQELELPQRPLTALDRAIMELLPSSSLLHLSRTSFHRVHKDLLFLLIHPNKATFFERLATWYTWVPDRYKLSAITDLDPATVTVFDWQFYSLLAFYHVIQIWTHRVMILKDLNETGTFNLNSSHFKLCLASAERIIEYLSVALVGNRRFVGIRMFWEAASFYGATIYIAIAMSSKDPIQLTQSIFNIERCLLSLGLLERYNFIAEESFIFPLRKLLSLATTKNRWLFDVSHGTQQPI